MSDRYSVVCSGQRLVGVVEVRLGTSLLAAIVRARVPIGRSCRGHGVCLACKVEIVTGRENLSPRDAVEDALPKCERLACRARVLGPLQIRTPYW